MSKSVTLDTDVLALLLNGTAIANLADNAASGPLTLLWVSLHTADPGTGGSQLTNEISYTGYTRISVARNGTAWTITSGSASPNSTITFPACTSGTPTATYAAIGTAASGAGLVLYSGAVTPSIAISPTIIPKLTTASVITEA